MDDWTWALIFLGIGLVMGIAVATKYQPTSTKSTCSSGVCPTIYENEDVYEWTDWRGVPRK